MTAFEVCWSRSFTDPGLQRGSVLYPYSDRPRPMQQNRHLCDNNTSDFSQ